jgi:hypothetical protein
MSGGQEPVEPAGEHLRKAAGRVEGATLARQQKNGLKLIVNN